MTRVTYLGITGSYGWQAAQQYASKHLDLQLIACPTFTECLRLVEDRHADVALLPVENSTEGGVGESNDLLLDTNLDMIGELRLHVSHCLIGFGQEKYITAIYSHRQALGQCRKVVSDSKQVSTGDTTEAVQIVKTLGDKHSAAIASEDAARIYNVPVIRKHINDVSENYTRFVMLGHGRSKFTGADKTTIRFKLLNEPGALHSALGAMTGVNMTRIESRPLKTGKWEYHFLVDFEGHRDDGTIVNVLERLRENTRSLHVLGSYKTGS